MKLEEQCCSLELSKKLKILGVKQESIWYREISCGTVWRDEELQDANGVLHAGDCVSAFTVAELFNMMPEHIDLDGFSYSYHFMKDCWGAYFSRHIRHSKNTVFLLDRDFHSDHNPANCIAEHYAELIEKGIIDPKREVKA